MSFRAPRRMWFVKPPTSNLSSKCRPERRFSFSCQPILKPGRREEIHALTIEAKAFPWSCPVPSTAGLRRAEFRYFFRRLDGLERERKDRLFRAGHLSDRVVQRYRSTRTR